MSTILDCGHAPSAHSSITTGYGKDAAGKTYCYDCCTARDLEQLRDTSKPFSAYISCDGKTVTNWPGRALMKITAEWSGRSGFCRDLHFYRATDAHGQHWHGKGSGRGMFITLRASK